MQFDQTFELHDLAIVGLLVVLEGVLSIDNALVLGLLAKRLPKREQARALTYGLIGAFLFRFLSIATAQTLLTYRIVKLLGGVYLFYVALKYFWDCWREGQSEQTDSANKDSKNKDSKNNVPADNDQGENRPQPAAGEPDEIRRAGFWSTVLVIELTDIAFAVDSILAAIALVGSPPTGHVGWHPKLWVVVTGGMLGVILMRYAAVVFIKMLERFPRFETAAYLLVMVIGGKLVLDWGFNTNEHHILDFHSPRSLAFWIFWLLMICSFCVGFIPKRNPNGASDDAIPQSSDEVEQVGDQR